MIDYLVKYRDAKEEEPKTSAEQILISLSEQLYEVWKNNGIFTYVGASSSTFDGNMTITLNMMSGNDDKQYFYRLIEIEQPLGTDYPINISAFQNPPTYPKKIEGPDQLNAELIEIMGSPRIKLIIDHVQKMGALIKAWKEEDEHEGEVTVH